MTYSQASETRSEWFFKLQHELDRVIADAASALVLFRAEPEAYFAVITEQDMPGTTGLEVSQRLIAGLTRMTANRQNEVTHEQDHDRGRRPADSQCVAADP